VQTKVLALVFCAWVEANFSKVIHTPYGFNLDEIRQIKEFYRANGLEKGWEKCIELGLRKVKNRKRSNYIPNIDQQLKRLVKDCVVEPSLIRNKIAHGQWEIALNRQNTSVNTELTKQLSELDAVTIDIWFRAHHYLAEIIESLIESPNRSFHRDYTVKIAELDNFLRESKGWSLDEKAKLLKRKPIRKPQSESQS
jgi:hypothetical protein